MTIPEAARLVLQAAAIGETSQVYVLDMGEPVKIVDLARDMIRLAGHSLSDVPIVFTGLRPGEKLYEELLADADHTLPTAHPRLRIAALRAQADPGLMATLESGLGEHPSGAPDFTVRRWLAGQVSEYRLGPPA